MRNQLIFMDLGVIVGIDGELNEDVMAQIGEGVRSWVDGTDKVLILPIANWEIIDRRLSPPKDWGPGPLGQATSSFEKGTP